MHTVHDNLLVGPDAVETVEKENTETRAESIKTVFDKQTQTMPALSKRDIITYFTGVRAPTFEEDFIPVSYTHLPSRELQRHNHNNRP